MPNYMKIVLSVCIIVLLAFGIWYLYDKSANIPTTLPPVNNPSGEVLNPSEDPSSHTISKYASMYITLFDDLMTQDPGLNHDMKFISIDKTTLDKEYANEELKETTKVFHLDETDLVDIVEHMKQYHTEIKTNAFDELKSEGHFDEETYSLAGILIYVQNIKIIKEDQFEISLAKYRSGLGAIFPTYLVQYIDGQWQFEITSTSIS